MSAGGEATAAGSTDDRRAARRLALPRLLAVLVDWGVLLLWGAVLFGVTWATVGVDLETTPSAGEGQLLGLLTMTLPAVLGFAVLEARGGATPGKRLLGLAVVDAHAPHADGAAPVRLGFGRALLRNALKFTPWEAGHTVVWQLSTAGEAGPPAWIWAAVAVSMLGPQLYVGTLLLRGRTPYDVAAGCAVVRAADLRA